MRRIVTADTEHRRAIVKATIITSAWVTSAGMLWNAGPVASFSTAWTVVIGAGVIGLIVVGLILARRPERTVRRIVLKKPSDDVKRLQRLLERRWVLIARSVGLSDETSTLDALVVRVPRIVKLTVVPLGLRAEVTTLPGQSPAKIVDARERLQSALEHEVRASSIGPNAVELIIVLNDVLGGMRHTEEPPPNTPTTKIRIGRCEDGTDAILDLADPSHTAIQGQTRSGKSVLAYGVLSAMANSDIVHIVGIDPNAVLLRPFAESSGRPDDFVLGADAPAALALLDREIAHLDARIEMLAAQKIDAFRSFTRECQIRTIVLEEYGGMLRIADAYDDTVTPKERVTGKIKARVARLVAEGAKAGIRVILITQRMDASMMGGDTSAQFGTRITMGVDNGDAVRMLHPTASPETIAAVVAFQPGEALLWQHRVEKRMKADLTEYDRYQARVAQMTPATNQNGDEA